MAAAPCCTGPAGVIAAAALIASAPRAIAGSPALQTQSQSPSARATFAQADAVRAFEFPRDHGPHPQFRQEWWYFTGNLADPAGERFGFELTFFRFALAPAAADGSAAADGTTAAAATAAAAAGAPSGAVSAWRARQIWMAHFAITDVSQGRFRFEQKLSREALGLAGAAQTGPGAAATDAASIAGGRGAPLRLWIEDWWIRLDDAPDGAAGNGGAWRLRASQPGYGLELALEPEIAPVLNGERGLSRKSSEEGAASYYYSVPRLQAHGRILRAGRPLPVRGIAWLDREWGSGALSPGQSGWDWFALQLDDGAALMFYALRGRGGARDRFSAGTWMAASNGTRTLSNDEVHIDVTDHWTNAAGDRYPAGWRLRVPALALDLALHPVLADQELATTPRYWEGAVDVRGTRAGRAAAGRGYVELVGYAQERPREAQTGAGLPPGR